MSPNSQDRGLIQMARELELNASALESVLPALRHRPYVHNKVVDKICELAVSKRKLLKSQDVHTNKRNVDAAAPGNDKQEKEEVTRLLAMYQRKDPGRKSSKERKLDTKALAAVIPTVSRCQPKALLVYLKKEMKTECRRLEATEASSHHSLEN